MTEGLSRTRSPAWSRAAEQLFPGYFALVMATGILSLAAHFLDLELLASVLFWINLVAYSVLGILTLVRLVMYPRKLVADLVDHARGPGFFTLVAGTCILGSQFAILRGELGVAAALWYFGIGLWLLITYPFFAAVTTRDKKPTLGEGLNGSWLVAVVATQSIAVLGSLVAPWFSAPEGPLFVAVAMHLAGFMLYLPLIGLLLYRWIFLDITPRQLTPPYWINMGALAISTLAGARLLQVAASSRLLLDLTPFLRGSTFFFWAAATWWIPLLLVLGFWRHAIRRFPLTYDPQYWGMVFPLGMYTVCTIQLARALDLPQLMPLARAFVWLAFAAWLTAFVGMCLTLARPEARRAGPGI